MKSEHITFSGVIVIPIYPPQFHFRCLPLRLTIFLTTFSHLLFIHHLKNIEFEVIGLGHAEQHGMIPALLTSLYLL